MKRATKEHVDKRSGLRNRDGRIQASAGRWRWQLKTEFNGKVACGTCYTGSVRHK